MFFDDHIYDNEVYVEFLIDKEIDSKIYKQVNDIMHLIHILLVVGTEDDSVVKLTLDTLVGLGLTIADGKRMVEDLLNEIQGGNET